MRRKLIFLFLILSVLLSGCLFPSYEPENLPSPAEDDGGLAVHFLDVGQADCILIRQGEHAMLIDAGNNDDDAFIISYLQEAGISSLDYAVGTHPHEDHIGSLDAVLQTFPVQTLLMPKVQTNTKTFEDVLDAAIAKNISITAPQAGDTFLLGNAALTAVNHYTGDDLNNHSIMLRLTYGDVSFLFVGDAEVPAEEAALATFLPLQSDVLKVGHHGSSTSSSSEFLATVSPAYAVISCGKDNDYGHPHRETLKKLAGCTLYRTDTDGTVIASSDGKTLTWHTTDLPDEDFTYILNTASNKFHLPTCEGAQTMSEKHKEQTDITRQQLLAAGYTPCGNCKP